MEPSSLDPCHDSKDHSKHHQVPAQLVRAHLSKRLTKPHLVARMRFEYTLVEPTRELTRELTQEPTQPYVVSCCAICSVLLCHI